MDPEDSAWTPEEQAEHRDLWVAALRSGKYQQATSVLRGSEGGFCCLGVACEISGLGKWDGMSTYVIGSYRVNQQREYEASVAARESKNADCPVKEVKHER